MESHPSQGPIALTCPDRGRRPKLITSILVPRTGRTIRMFTCECGKRGWIDSAD